MSFLAANERCNVAFPSLSGGAISILFSILGTYVLPHGQWCWSGGLVRSLQEFGVTEASGRQALSRLTTRGFLTRQRHGRLMYYTLSARGKAELGRGERRIFSFGRETWAGLWTTVVYTFAEGQRSERDRLRLRLEFLGFAPVIDGVWCAPYQRDHDIGEVLTDLDVSGEVYLLVGSVPEYVDMAHLVSTRWDWPLIQGRYASFMRRFSLLRDARKRDAMSPRQAYLYRTALVHQFRTFPAIDPGVPVHFIHVDIKRDDVVDFFHDSYDALGPAAQDYFDEIAPHLSSPS